MSKRLGIRSLVILPLLAFAAFLLVAADAGALAQNANSSATQDTAAEEAPAPRRNRARRGRGRTRRPRAAAPADANVSPEQDSTQGGAADANANLAGGVDTDLSGTYTGPLTLTGGHEMSGDATLTITGNQFTLEAGGMSHTGRVLAVTSRGYTGATLFFSDVTDAVTNTPLAVSVRARRRGDRLTLEPVPGARNIMRFGVGGGRGSGRRRG